MRLFPQNSVNLRTHFVDLLRTQGIDHRFIHLEFNYNLKSQLKTCVRTYSRLLKDARALERLLVRRDTLWTRAQAAQRMHRDLVDQLAVLDRDIRLIGGL